MSFKDLVRSPLRAAGYDIVRFTPEFHRPFPVLPLLVRERLQRGGDFFVLQVGANDGVLDDPVHDLVVAHRLPGLMIEPLPDLFEKLQANYAGQTQLRFENIAVMPEPGRLTIHRVRRDAPVHAHWHGIASFSRANLVAQGVPEQHIEAQEVPGEPLSAILQRHGVAEVGLLQVDTEGFDFEVIKSAFAAGLKPEMINYEHCWLPPDQRLACKHLLDARGYDFLEVGKDTLALRRA